MECQHNAGAEPKQHQYGTNMWSMWGRCEIDLGRHGEGSASIWGPVGVDLCWFGVGEGSIWAAFGGAVGIAQACPLPVFARFQGCPQIRPTGSFTTAESFSTATPSTVSARLSMAREPKDSALTQPRAESSKAKHRPAGSICPRPIRTSHVSGVRIVQAAVQDDIVAFRFTSSKATQPASTVAKALAPSTSMVTLGPIIPKMKEKRLDMMDPAMPVPAARCSQPPDSMGPESIMLNSERCVPTYTAVRDCSRLFWLLPALARAAYPTSRMCLAVGCLPFFSSDHATVVCNRKQ